MSESNPSLWNKALLGLVAAVTAFIPYAQGQLYHYGQLEALRVPISLFPVDLQGSWMLAYEANLRFMPIVADAVGPALAWLLPMSAILALCLMFVLVKSFRGVEKVERPVTRWWRRHQWTRDFRVTMRGWLTFLVGGIGVPYMVFMGMAALFLFSSLSYFVGRASINDYRKDHFRGFAELESTGPSQVGARPTRLFECRGDFCVLIRDEQAVSVPRNRLDGYIILGRSLP